MLHIHFPKKIFPKGLFSKKADLNRRRPSRALLSLQLIYPKFETIIIISKSAKKRTYLQIEIPESYVDGAHIAKLSANGKVVISLKINEKMSSNDAFQFAEHFFRFQVRML